MRSLRPRTECKPRKSHRETRQSERPECPPPGLCQPPTSSRFPTKSPSHRCAKPIRAKPPPRLPPHCSQRQARSFGPTHFHPTPPRSIAPQGNAEIRSRSNGGGIGQVGGSSPENATPIRNCSATQQSQVLVPSCRNRKHFAQTRRHRALVLAASGCPATKPFARRIRESSEPNLINQNAGIRICNNSD